MVHAVFRSVHFPNRTCDYLQSCFLVLGGLQKQNASKTTPNTKSYWRWTVVYTLYDYRLLFFSDSIRLWDLIPARLSNAWPATNPDCFIRRELKRDSTMKDDESLNPDNTFCQAQVDVQKMIDQLKEQSESTEDDE